MDKAEGVKYDKTCVCLHLESKRRQGQYILLLPFPSLLFCPFSEAQQFLYPQAFFIFSISGFITTPSPLVNANAFLSIRKDVL